MIFSQTEQRTKSTSRFKPYKDMVLYKSAVKSITVQTSPSCQFVQAHSDKLRVKIEVQMFCIFISSKRTLKQPEELYGTFQVHKKIPRSWEYSSAVSKYHQYSKRAIMAGSDKYMSSPFAMTQGLGISLLSKSPWEAKEK